MTENKKELAVEKCVVNSSGDLFMDSEARKFIRQQCTIIKKTKSGLIQISLDSDSKQVISLPKRNLDLL